MADRVLIAPPNGGIPNHPRWGALIRAGAMDVSAGADAVRDRIAAHGWGGLWVWTVFDYHHFHPASHEALLCVSGTAMLRLGGEAGEDVEVGPGDGLVLPAGFGHRLVRSDAGFRVVGAYPPGQEDPEILRAEEGAEERCGARIAALPRPETDPFSGGRFPDLWEA